MIHERFRVPDTKPEAHRDVRVRRVAASIYRERLFRDIVASRDGVTGHLLSLLPFLAATRR